MAEAIELATVYLPVIPSFGGMEGNIGAQFGAPLLKEAEKAGEEGGKGFADKFGGAAKIAMATAGVAIGAALLGGMNTAIDAESGNNKLTAQLALTAQESESYGAIAGSLYADAYGGSMEEVNGAIKSVVQNVGGMRGATEDELSGVTAKVLSVANTFDQDLGGVTTAVGQMMKTGMAKDAEEALDIITVGLQTNGNVADDVMDTFTEYPALFQRLGVDGQTAMGLINQGMAGGARNTDLVADALKEFQIRATDGSKSSAEGFAALGINAAEMTAQIAAGGPGAAAGLDSVLDKLRAVEDPVARNAAAVALFGTQAEDLGGALFALDPSSAVTGLGEVAGAAAKVDEIVGSGTGPTMESFKRSMEGSFGAMMTSVLPILQPVLEFLTQFAPILGPLALAIGAVTAAQWLWNAAQLANPMTWIVLGIAAVVAGIIWLIANWDTAVAFLLALWAPIGDFFTSMWSGITLGAQIAWEALKGLIAGAWQGIVWVFQNLYLPGFILSHWDQIVAFTTIIWNGIAAFFGGIWDGIVGSVSAGIGNVVGWFSGMVDSITGFFNGLVEAASSFGTNIVEGILNGVRSMGSNVAAVFGDLLPDWVTGPFAAALGIHSPSRVFMGMGEDTADGFLIGAESKDQIIKKSMETMVTIPKVPTSSMQPAMAGVGVGVGGDTIRNEFNLPDTDVDTLAELVVKKQDRKKRY